MAEGWRTRATALLKKELVKATSPKDIRDISSALRDVQPYEESAGIADRPMPVRVVKARGRPKKGAWRKKKAN